MEKLQELKDKAEKATNDFIYAKPNESLKELYKAQELAYKELRDYKDWLYKGSGVNGNEI